MKDMNLGEYIFKNLKTIGFLWNTVSKKEDNTYQFIIEKTLDALLGKHVFEMSLYDINHGELDIYGITENNQNMISVVYAGEKYFFYKKHQCLVVAKGTTDQVVSEIRFDNCHIASTIETENWVITTNDSSITRENYKLVLEHNKENYQYIKEVYEGGEPVQVRAYQMSSFPLQFEFGSIKDYKLQRLFDIEKAKLGTKPNWIERLTGTKSKVIDLITTDEYSPEFFESIFGAMEEEANKNLSFQSKR